MAVEKHVQFVRAVMDYASSLETILLEDKDHCGYCDEVSSNLAYSSIGSMFPKNKRNQEFPKNKRKRHDAKQLPHWSFRARYKSISLSLSIFLSLLLLKQAMIFWSINWNPSRNPIINESRAWPIMLHAT